jgi:hypothetical protein
MLTIACVLKSGGDYDWEYVNRLKKNIDENITHEYKFVIFTDMWESKQCPPEGVEIRYLESEFKTYWSKLELFRLTGEVLYFDLDTIILNGLDFLIEGIRTMVSFHPEKDHFFMMKAFNRHRRYASGILAWNGDFEWLYSSTKPEMIERYGKWEQDYIVDRLCSVKQKINFIDDCMGGGIISYKHHCIAGIPKSANIICFHGKPRPREVNWLEEVLIGK